MKDFGVLWFFCFYSGFRKRKKFEGELFFCYLAGYGAGRFWIESLRTDQLLLPGIHVPVSQMLSAVLVVVSLSVIIVKEERTGSVVMTKETLKIQIEDTRKYLNQSITEKQSADKILEISVKLDKLIEEYLNTKE